jgi:hypothetical protein
MTIAKVYGLAMQSIINKEVDFDTDTVSVALCTDTYTPNQDTHQYASDLTNELSGGGYARQTLGTPTVAYTGGTNTLKLDGVDVTFTGITASSIRYAIFFMDTGADSVSPLLCYQDFETNQNLTAQDLTLVLNANGLLTFTTA